MYSDDFQLTSLNHPKKDFSLAHSEQQYSAQLCNIVMNQSDLIQRLIYLRYLHPYAYLSAGVIRNLV